MGFEYNYVSLGLRRLESLYVCLRWFSYDSLYASSLALTLYLRTLYPHKICAWRFLPVWLHTASAYRSLFDRASTPYLATIAGVGWVIS